MTQTIRDAASIVVADLTEGELRLLLGRRRPTEVFLPNMFVFPGGRVDPGDRSWALGMDPAERAALMLAPRDVGGTLEPDAFACAAIRELFEETGTIIGTRGDPPACVPAGWDAFCATGYSPDLRQLSYFARAITPEGRPRRYDTRFFLAPSSAIALSTGFCDGELTDVAWYTRQAIAALDAAPITRLVLDEVYLLAGPQSRCAPRNGVPFFVPSEDGFERRWLGLHTSLADLDRATAAAMFGRSL